MRVNPFWQAHSRIIGLRDRIWAELKFPVILAALHDRDGDPKMAQAHRRNIERYMAERAPLMLILHEQATDLRKAAHAWTERHAPTNAPRAQQAVDLIMVGNRWR